jgi:hypothetical protein
MELHNRYSGAAQQEKGKAWKQMGYHAARKVLIGKRRLKKEADEAVS